MADNLLDKASILLTPTAYNDGSMLSVKPDNGDGDFTFSRGSAATRVNAQGLVENVQIISPELVSNGNFSQIGTEEVLNGNFSQEGSELVTNGDFATDSDWNKVNATISGGKGNLDGDGQTSILWQDILTNGSSYKATFTVSDYNGLGDAKVINNNGISIFNITSNGTFTIYFQHNIASGNILFRALSGAVFSIDNVSVKEVGQNWTLDTGWSIGDGYAESTALSTRSIYQNIGNAVVGKIYKVTYTILETNGGNFRAVYGGVNGTMRNTEGTYVEYFNATSSADDNLYLDSLNVFIGKIDNISVKEVGQDWTFGTGYNMGDGKVVITNSSSSNLEQLGITITNTKKYKIDFTISDYTSGSIRPMLGSVGAVAGTYVSENGVYTETLTANNNFDRIVFRTGGTAFNGSIDNISVKEITDDTDIPRIDYEGFSYQDSLGSEEVVNGDFSNGSANWFNPDGAATFSNNSVTINGGSGNRRINQPNVTSPTTSQFKLQYEITEKVGTSDLKVYTNNSGSAAYTIVPSTIGVHTFYFSSNLTTFYFNFSDSSGSITIDNVSVKEVTGQEVVPDSGCGSWLLEGQSTNLVNNSELLNIYFTNKVDTTITDNYGTSPSGETNSSRIQFVDDTSFCYSAISVSTDHTSSVFVKGVSGETVRFGIGSSVVTGDLFTFNGLWQRIDFTASSATQIFFSSYGGATTRDFEAFGLQLEALSYATSYIPTSGATNTRLQDIANNSGNASLINSTEGVLAFKTKYLVDDGTSRKISISDGSSSNRLYITPYQGLTSRLRYIFTTGGVNQADLQITGLNLTSENIFAIVWGNNRFELWSNGVKISEDTNGITPPQGIFNLLTLGSELGNNTELYQGFIDFIAVYKEALTDAELQSLTTI